MKFSHRLWTQPGRAFSYTPWERKDVGSVVVYEDDKVVEIAAYVADGEGGYAVGVP